MFWKVSSFSSGSAVEGILDKQQVTLEELLEEDELVQVSSLHSRFCSLTPFTLTSCSCAWLHTCCAYMPSNMPVLKCIFGCNLQLQLRCLPTPTFYKLLQWPRVSC